jgi:signal transduction histidine kinase/ActR/RegA family two-component response regulator
MSSLRKIVLRALLLPSALTLLLVALTTTEILYLRQLGRWVEHTHAVLGSAAHSYRLIIDQETGMRGYILTGTPSFLEPYEKGRRAAPLVLGELARLVRDNPSQALRVEELGRELADWQRRASEILALPRGADGSLGSTTSQELNRAKDHMDDIRQRIDAVVIQERDLLEQRRNDVAAISRILLFGGGGLVLLLGVFVTLMLQRQIRAIEAIYRTALLEREASEAREREARGQAETANRAKDEFLATVSHELRTPLTSMLGWTRLLRGDKLSNEKRQRALESIERNAVAQAQLIEDLLDVSRIVAGKLRLDVQETDIERVIDAAIDGVRPALEGKQIRLQSILDPACSSLLGDPSRLQQVVWNLLANAVKFTPKGGRIQVSLKRINSHLEIAVRDDGQGIELEFLPRIFQRFQQADSGESRAYGGLGLGLAISRHLVELHGGTIEAASDGPQRGATFTIKLPLMPVQRAAAAASASGSAEPRVHPTVGRDVTFECPPELRGLKVLVVDDEADTRDLLASVVSQCGAVVEEAASATEALAAIPSFRPDVILSDVGMPGEDGYELVRKVRRLSREQGGRTPAAALTAYARPEDRRQAMRAGFEMHLPKPVEPAELVAALATLARIGEAMK